MIEDANFWKKSSRLYIVVVVADFMYGVNVDELYGLSLFVHTINVNVTVSNIIIIAAVRVQPDSTIRKESHTHAAHLFKNL